MLKSLDGHNILSYYYQNNSQEQPEGSPVRQENAEVYRDFAEELYSRTEATPIDQGIIDLLDSD